MKKVFVLLLLIVPSIVMLAQKSDCVNITLRPRVGFEKVDFDSIVIKNWTQGTQKTLYFPDTILSNCTTGVENFVSNRPLKLSQAFPTPCDGRASVKLDVPEDARTVLTLWNIQGCVCCQRVFELSAGEHFLDIHISAPGFYLLKADNGATQTTVKLLSARTGDDNDIVLESSLLKNTKATSDEPFFNMGDRINPIAYITWKGDVRNSALSNDCYVETDGLFVLDIAVRDTFPVFPLANKHIQVLKYDQEEPFHADFYLDEVAYEVFFYDSVLLSVQVNPIENLIGYPYCLDGWQVQGWHKYKDSTFCDEDGNVIHNLSICGMDENLSESSVTHSMNFIAHRHQIMMYKLGWNFDWDVVGCSPVRFKPVFP